MLSSAAGLLFWRGLKSLRTLFLQSFREEPKPAGWRSQSRRPSAAGRMKSPEAVTDSKGGIRTADHAAAKPSSAPWSKKFAVIAARFELPKTLQEEWSPPPSLRIGRFSFARFTMHIDRWDKATGLTASLDIASPLESRFVPLVECLVGPEAHDGQPQRVYGQLVVFHVLAEDIGDAGRPSLALEFGMICRVGVHLFKFNPRRIG